MVEIEVTSQRQDIILALAKSFEEEDITALLIYKAGKIIHEELHSNKHQTATSSNILETLNSTFLELLDSLPRSHLQSILDDINQAFTTLSSNLTSLIESQSSSSSSSSNLLQITERERADVQDALHSLVSIYTCSPLACQIGADTELCVAIVECYEIFLIFLKVPNVKTMAEFEIQNTMKLLSSLFLDGILFQNNTKNNEYNNDEDDDHNDDDDNLYDTDDEIEDNHDDSYLNTFMEAIQILQNYSETCVGDLLQWQRRNLKSSMNLVEIIRNKYDSNDVRASYAIDMIQSSLTYEQYMETKQKSHKQQNLSNRASNTNKKKSNDNAYVDPILPLIQKVQSVYPELGQGFIEIGLACYNYDAELLVSTLSSNDTQLHPRLLYIDKNLPRMTQKTQEYLPGKHDQEDEDGKTARKMQKEFLSNMMEQQENENYIVSKFLEYDDDYDDQYDGIGNDGKVGGAGDDTEWEHDYEAVKVYNTFAKTEEAEKTFWEENRNTNRNEKNQSYKRNNDNDSTTETNDNNHEQEENKNQNNDEKKWGPDKGKGGRIIGPDGKYLPFPKKNNRKKKQTINSEVSNDQPLKNKGKGGKNIKGNKNDNMGTQKNSNGEMTKIQKRRKNDNKAKIGNHNRKDRALKKSGGM